MKTDWFGKNTTPYRVGIYEIKVPWWHDEIFMSYWDGKKWSYFSVDNFYLQEYIQAKITHGKIRFEWRGFTKEQK